MTEILLPRGHVLLVDDADAQLVSRRRWHAIPARSTFYAQAGDDTSTLLHRWLLDVAPGVLVDHINRNGLDNRRANLRLATTSQNHANRPAPSNNTSGYKGVSRARSGRWVAYITVDYRRTFLGTFDTAWRAAQAYNAAALEAWGEFALLNVYRPQSARDGGPGCPGPRGATLTGAGR